MRRGALAVIGAVVASSVVTHAGHGDFDLLVRPAYTEAAPRVTAARPSVLSAERRIVSAAVDRYAAHYGIPRDLFHRLVKRESGYNPRAVGPRTRWGRAIGPTQILCSTAASLGEPDCNRLLRDSDRAVQLAALYLRQGYAATGSWAGAAAYYHGGPDRRIHGPKTAAYAIAVAGGYGRTRSAWNVAAIPPSGVPAHNDFNLMLRGG